VFSGISGQQDSSETENLNFDPVTVTGVGSGGNDLRTGLGFLYDETTLVCSFSDVKGATRVRIAIGDVTSYSTRVQAFSEAMDLAVLSLPQEMAITSPIVSSGTVPVNNAVWYLVDRGTGWERAKGTVHQILDTGKGHHLILIESGTYSRRSSPLYDSDGRIIGWLQGKRAIAMETIAAFAEKSSAGMEITEIHSNQNPWKFVKPATSERKDQLIFSSLRGVSGPAAFPFRLQLPDGSPPVISIKQSQFHARYEYGPITVEVRAAPLNDANIIAAIAREENLGFTDFLRVEMTPFSADYVTGFLAFYEDTDPFRPYKLQVFYTSFRDSLYFVSVAYPEEGQHGAGDFARQVFASFRF
jgi:hypothetical protein